MSGTGKPGHLAGAGTLDAVFAGVGPDRRHTGLFLIGCAFLTLFVVMQMTGRLDWEVVLGKRSAG